MIKFLSSVENLNSFFEWSSVVLLALTFIAGAGTVITSRIVNRRQAATILGLQTAASEAKAAQQHVEIDLAKAREAQAKAESESQLSLLRLNRFVREPRTVDHKK